MILTYVLIPSRNPSFVIFAPEARVNGELVSAHWGINQIQLPPGRHHLRISMRIGKNWGIGEAYLDTKAGGLTLHYAAPYLVKHEGRIDTTPPRPAGAVAFYAGVVVPLHLLYILFLMKLTQ